MHRIVWSSLLVLVLGIGVAGAATIHVAPGPGTPVQDAIDAASPGDTIALERGRYDESNLFIAKRLKLLGKGSVAEFLADTTHFAGPCSDQPMVVIAADDVRVRGIAFVGARGGAVAVTGHTRVRLQDLFVLPSCGAVQRAGIDVDASAKVTMTSVWSAGFPNVRPNVPAIRIANAGPHAHITARKSGADHSAIGVLLDNDGDRSVTFSGGYVNFNDRGIVLRNTVGATISRNREVIDNDVTGIEIEAGSSGNRIIGNRVQGSATDLLDAGTNNCWRGNTFTTGSDPGCS